MADPKYANLPGIDLDQPDVYETSDLPEDDQNQLQEEDVDSESIEKLKINATEAFSSFKGKPGVSSSGIDFSDRVSKARRTGYDIPRTEYEMLGDGSEVRETPQQKYQRLQHEIRELAEEVTQIKDNLSSENSSEAQSPVNLAKQVEYLQQQLTDLHLDKLLGSPSSDINLSDPHGALQKRLLTELDGFKAGKSEASKPAAGDGQAVTPGGDVVSYQLYYRPEQAKFSNNAKLADLEERLEAMESLLGSSHEKLSALTADTSNKSLLGAVALLSAKTRLLEPSQLDQVEGRLVALNQRLAHIAEKKEAIEQGDKQTKIAELYEIVKKWNSLSDTLPHIVDRLATLKELHEQALQFSQALAHLDTAQQQITSHLHAHGDMLKQVQSNLAENMASIKNNFEGLETRMTNLSKK